MGKDKDKKKSKTNAHRSAALVLRLYELRREPVMREARQWFASFNPASAEEMIEALLGPHGAHYRMVTTYWDMAASFVNSGAIDQQIFCDANNEHVFVYSKIAAHLDKFREIVGAPKALQQLEKLIKAMPDSKERLTQMADRWKRIAEFEARNSAKSLTESAPISDDLDAIEKPMPIAKKTATKKVVGKKALPKPEPLAPVVAEAKGSTASS